MVDTHAWGACGLTAVRVQLPLWAPYLNWQNYIFLYYKNVIKEKPWKLFLQTLLGIIQKTEIKVFCDFIVCKNVYFNIKLLYSCYFGKPELAVFLLFKFFIMKTIEQNIEYKESLDKVWNNLENCLEFMTGSVLSLINNTSHISYAWSRYSI